MGDDTGGGGGVGDGVGGDADLLFLSCDEELYDDDDGSAEIAEIASSSSSVPDLHYLDRAIDPDEAQSLRNIAGREADHSPGARYRAGLVAENLISAARSNAVDWMIKVRNVYGFGSATVAASVSYFDRYLAKEIRNKVWKAWMIELVSIACLSLAAKMEESFVPLLKEFQIQGLDHRFESVTIQRMEVSVMKVLDWRLNSITPFSFVGGFLRTMDLQKHLKMLVWRRTEELLLGTLSETIFLDFSPSILAISATVCALEESVPLQAEAAKQTLLEMLQIDEASFEKCYRAMEEQLVDPICPVASSSRVLLLNAAAAAASLRACSSPSSSSSEGESESESESESLASRKRIKLGDDDDDDDDDADAASKKNRSAE